MYSRKRVFLTWRSVHGDMFVLKSLCISFIPESCKFHRARSFANVTAKFTGIVQTKFCRDYKPLASALIIRQLD